MRSRASLVAGVGAAAIALAGCATTISGSAAPAGTSGSGYAAPVRTVEDLGAAVSHNTQASAVHMNMAVTVPEVGTITASGDAKFASSQPSEQMTMTIPSVGDMKIVLVSGTIYMSLPPNLSGALSTSGKPWVKLDLNSLNPQFQSLSQSAGLAGQADPTQLLQQISAAGTITKVTHETVDGVPTTHYSITVDVAKMLRSTNASDQEKQALAQLGITTMPFDIWVNSDNLPVRIVTNVPFSEGTTSGQPLSISVNYSNWGEPVTVTAPPADQVTPLGGN